MHSFFLEAPRPCLPKAPQQLLPLGRGEKAESDMFLALCLEMNDPGVFLRALFIFLLLSVGSMKTEAERNIMSLEQSDK